MQPLAPLSAGVRDGVSGRLALVWSEGPNGSFKLRATLLLHAACSALEVFDAHVRRASRQSADLYKLIDHIGIGAGCEFST